MIFKIGVQNNVREAIHPEGRRTGSESSNVSNGGAYYSSSAGTIATNRSNVADMNAKSLLDSTDMASNITFVARKVRLASEYYVEVSVPGRLKYRIGSFKLRARAKEWITVHSTQWLPESDYSG